jgi:hypothetical protein
MMHAHAIALAALLLAAVADPAEVRTQSHDTPAVGPVQAASGRSADKWIQLAAGGKLSDKYLAGQAGGRYGIGGPEQRKKKRNKKDGK